MENIKLHDHFRYMSYPERELDKRPFSEAWAEFLESQPSYLKDYTDRFKRCLEWIDTQPNRLMLANTRIGIEVEAENIAHSTRNEWWTRVNDGSLRNNGAEFITNVGLKLIQLPDAIAAFKRGVINHNPQVDFTPRTSVHVHVDVQNLTFLQLQTLVAVYLLLEEGLFSMVNPSRKHNLFCLPLRESGMSTEYKVYEQLQSWSKYSALNLKTTTTYGTVEFRHMHGEFTPIYLAVWVMILTRLVVYVRTTPIKNIRTDVMSIKGESTYKLFLDTVLGDLQEFMTFDPLEFDLAATDAKIVLSVY